MFQPQNCWINLDEIQYYRYLWNIAATILFFIDIWIMRCVLYLSKYEVILHVP